MNETDNLPPSEEYVLVTKNLDVHPITGLPWTTKTFNDYYDPPPADLREWEESR